MSGAEQQERLRRADTLRMLMANIDDRGNCVGLGQILMLPDDACRHLEEYAARAIFADTVTAPAEWAALVERRVGRVLALLMVATGVTWEGLQQLANLPGDRMRALRGGEEPTADELADILRGIAVAVLRQARPRKRADTEPLQALASSSRGARF